VLAWHRHALRGEIALAANLTARSAAIFSHVATRAWNGTEAACGGGIYWSTQRSYKNAIANELFLATAAKLGAVGGERGLPESATAAARQWAVKEWDWFYHSGMLNNASLVNDGLGHDCQNNGAPTYTYNQGVILSGLSHLHELTGDPALLRVAEAIVDAVLLRLTDAGGVLEAVHCGDGSLFKGIFVRHLRYFLDANAAAVPAAKVRSVQQFLAANAESLWHSQDAEGKFPVYWGGGAPMVFASGTVQLQTAAIDLFVAADNTTAAEAEAAAAAAEAAEAEAGGPSASAVLSAGTAGLDLSARPAAPAQACSGVGQRVLQRCVCPARFTGAACQRQIGWRPYYSSQGRQVVLVTASGRFLSSDGSAQLGPPVSHLSTKELWSVVQSGSGVSLMDSAGKSLAIDTLRHEVAMVSASLCQAPEPGAHSPCEFTVAVEAGRGKDEGEAVVFRSALATGQPGTAWYLATAEAEAGTVVDGGRGERRLVVVVATPAEAAAAHNLRFRVRLEQFCQAL
jgi:predicted alpha-1,6-mannanase (GH76 family)